MSELVFALDIGTQSVTGILLKKTEDNFTIIDYCVKYHNERSMLDGQIQNVLEVADIITEVKEALEEKHGALHEVCVAAAGRALETVQASETISIKQGPLRTTEAVKHLELSAVQTAQQQLIESDKQTFENYHCVGYSVLDYQINATKIGSLIDQIGDEATVNIIATFLPRVVVESLIASLERAGLKMRALTLEPIAAIHVLVPESMRRLNIGLIDIGAGTSDIAISNQGTVIAYGMVPFAGDEITEIISDHYLLDFKIAEATKQELVNEQAATAQDVLGFDVAIDFEDFIQNIDEKVTELTTLIAEEIIKLNGKSPQAIMLIGGGSLTPMITNKLANVLQLPENRVAVRGVNAIAQLIESEGYPTGPNFVTPVGIAISATEKPLNFTSVKVNDKTIHLFETKDLTVGDCLIQAGININQYYGKIGLAKIVMINGEMTTLPGKYGEAPIITVNGEPASVNQVIEANDHLEIHKGCDGETPNVTLAEVVGDLRPITVYFHNVAHEISPKILVNNEAVADNYIIQDKDVITISHANTVNQFIAIHSDTAKEITVFVNERAINLPVKNNQVLLNGENAHRDTILQDGDRIEQRPIEKITVKHLLAHLNIPYIKKIPVYFNDRLIELQQQLVEITRDDLALTETTQLFNGDTLILQEKADVEFIFQDIFRYVDLDPKQLTGQYRLYKNNLPTSFHETIFSGDKLAIKWE